MSGAVRIASWAAALLGQKTKANSLSVTFASDEEGLPTNITGDIEIATDAGAGATIGTTGDSAVVTNTTGTLSGKLRGVVALLVDVITLLTARLPTLGTAGSPSSNVISVQGVASGTAQPVSGTVTANAGTNLNTSLLAVESGGNLTSIATSQASITGVKTLAHTTATATTTSSAMLASNSNRKYAFLQNIGTVDVYIKVNATAVASQGILLPAGGGFYEMSMAAGNLDTRAINGITASGSATVLATEG